MTYSRSLGFVTHGRDEAGRLTGLTLTSAATSGAHRTVMSVRSEAGWQTAARPTEIALGLNLVRRDTYDHRKRLVQRAYTRTGGTSGLVAGFYYGYDGANRETMRVDSHRAGRANLARYNHERLSAFELATRPGDSSAAPWSSLVGTQTWGAGDASWAFSYDSQGMDRVTAVTAMVPPGDTAYFDVAQDYTSVDSMGHSDVIDGFTRTRDSLGNVLTTESPWGALRLTYDGLSRLRTASATGRHVTYSYRADGALAEREVTCPPPASLDCQGEHRVYVYRGLLLLQEFEVSGALPQLRAQYYYADEGDIPVAVDLYDTAASTMRRYYYLVDRMGSIVGLTDATGTVVERVDYSPWGAPRITAPDTAPPRVAEIRAGAADELLVTFSEPVDPAFMSAASLGTGASVQWDVTVRDLMSEVQVVNTSATPVALSVASVRVVQEPSAPYGSVYSVRMTQPLAQASTYTLTLAAGAVQDGWMNTNPAEVATFPYPANVVANALLHSGAAGVASTGAVVLERSAVGNRLGFQAHLHDWDVDLVLMRARVFEPRTGMFLQRDPEGYEDSVNLYAGMRWDPVNLRDPTGRNTGAMQECLSNPYTSDEYCHELFSDVPSAPTALQRANDLGRRALRWVTGVDAYERLAPHVISADDALTEIAENEGADRASRWTGRLRPEERFRKANVPLDMEYSRQDVDRLVGGMATETYRQGRDQLIGAGGGVIVGEALERGLNAARSRRLASKGPVWKGGAWRDSTGRFAKAPSTAARFPTKPGQIKHIFREGEGHLIDSPGNRDLLLDLANDASTTLGNDKFGDVWSARTLEDGTQAWVQTRNGVIQNGGLNQKPRIFNAATGLSRP